MRTSILLLSAAFFLPQFACDLAAQEPKEKAAFKFAEVEYFHRFTDADLYEYTPANQEDLQRWEDMVSINYYSMAKDGDALAKVANAVLGNYQKNGAKVIRTSSVPKSKEKPAEHLIVVMFVRAEFTEAAFARFHLHNGIGTSVIYSHRAYGDNSAKEIGTWLKSKGVETETTLMKWSEMPARPEPKAKPQEKDARK